MKEENAKLKSENEVLTQYIENLMASSTVIQSTTGQAAGYVLNCILLGQVTCLLTSFDRVLPSISSDYIHNP